MLDKAKFAQTMTGLSEIYNKEPSEFIFNTYYQVLKNFPDRIFEKAVVEFVKTNTKNRLPLPAELVELCRQEAKRIANLPEETDQITTGERWGISDQVHKTAVEFGCYDKKKPV